MAFRQFGAAAAVAVSLAFGASPAFAVTEIQWWHAMTGGNNDVIVKLANDFNASQSDYKVVPTYKGSYADTMNAGIAAFRAGNAPHIMQVFEVGTATMMAATGAVKPVYKLMQEAGEKFDPKAYLPAITGYYSTSKGEMLSFPFNSSSTVMWVNLDALKKANIAEIPKTWPEVFEDAKKLQGGGLRQLRLLQLLGHLGQSRAALGLAQRAARRARPTASTGSIRCSSSTARCRSSICKRWSSCRRTRPTTIPAAPIPAKAASPPANARSS